MEKDRKITEFKKEKNHCKTFSSAGSILSRDMQTKIDRMSFKAKFVNEFDLDKALVGHHIKIKAALFKFNYLELLFASTFLDILYRPKHPENRNTINVELIFHVMLCTKLNCSNDGEKFIEELQKQDINFNQSIKHHYLSEFRAMNFNFSLLRHLNQNSQMMESDYHIDGVFIDKAIRESLAKVSKKKLGLRRPDDANQINGSTNKIHYSTMINKETDSQKPYILDFIDELPEIYGSYVLDSKSNLSNQKFKNLDPSQMTIDFDL